MNARILLCALLLAAPASGAQNLREALDAAWLRSPQARSLEAQRGEVAARKLAADSLFAGAPSFGIAQRSDRLTQRAGRREWEYEVSAPIWLPGQRDARQALAQSEDSESQAALELQRLVLAGELRDVVWAAIAARNEAELAREREEGSRRLEGEVTRRFEAGDLARSDLLLARGEALASRMARVEAEASAVQALQRYRLLTGLDRLPAAPDEIVARRADGDAHPRIRASRNALQRAGASMQVARYSLRDNPEIGVQYQRDRDEFGAPSRDTIRLGVRIPFGTEARNAPLLAAASTEIARAQAEVLQVQAATQGEASVARAALEAAQEGRSVAVERQDSAAENLALVRRGFDLGELSLAQRLLAQTQYLEARAAFVRQTSSVGAASSRLNQALGVVP